MKNDKISRSVKKMKNTLFKTVLTSALTLAFSVGAEPISIDLGGGTAQSSAASQPSAQSDTVKLVARGIGSSTQEALKDAYRDAVERAVGLFVDAESIATNDELVHDQILTHSNAYVTHYDIVKEESLEGGLVQLRIVATVQKRAVVTKIQSVMPGVQVSVGNSLSNLHGQMTTIETRNKDGAVLMKNALEGLNPIKQLTRLSLASTQPAVSEKQSSEGKIRLGYLFKLEMDQQKYRMEYLPKLKQVLDQISLTPPRLVRMNDIGGIKDDSYLYYRKGYLEAKEKFEDKLHTAECTSATADLAGYYDVVHGYSWENDDGKIEVSAVNGGSLLTRGRYFDAQKGPSENEHDSFANGLEVFLVTDVNSAGAKGVFYTVDRETARAINAWQSQFTGNKNGQPKKLIYDIVFKDAQGDEVTALSWNFDACSYKGQEPGYSVGWNMVFQRVSRPPQWKRPQRNGDHKPEYVWFISPFLRGTAERYLVWHPFDFNKDDLARIASVSIDIAGE